MFLNFKQWLNETHAVKGGFVDVIQESPDTYQVIKFLASPNAFFPAGLPLLKMRESGARGQYILDGSDFAKIVDEVGKKGLESKMQIEKLKKEAETNPAKNGELQGIKEKLAEIYGFMNDHYRAFKKFAAEASDPTNSAKKYRVADSSGRTGFMNLSKYDSDLEDFIKAFSPHDNSYSYIRFPHGSSQGREKFAVTGSELKNMLQNFTRVSTPLQNNKRGMQKQEEHKKYLAAINKFMNDDSIDDITFVIDTAPSLQFDPTKSLFDWSLWN